MMEFRILGPLEVLSVISASTSARTSSARCSPCCCIHVDRVVPTDRILEELWGDDAAGKEKALWVHISRLRSALEPHRAERGASSVLITRDHGYLDPRRPRVGRRPPIRGRGQRGPGPTHGRSGRRRGDPARRARPVAGFGAAGLRLRRLRARGDRPARGAATRGGRDAHRCRSAAWTVRRAGRRVGDAGAAASAARAPGGPADARPLPGRATGRGAACLPAVPPRDR